MQEFMRKKKRDIEQKAKAEAEAKAEQQKRQLAANKEYARQQREVRTPAVLMPAAECFVQRVPMQQHRKS